MRGQFIILRGPAQRQLAHDLIDRAPPDSEVTVALPGRTASQNRLLWPLLSDVARQVQIGGRHHAPEVWKSVFMSALGEEARMMEGLHGEAVNLGYRTSKLSKARFAELIELIYAEGTARGVVFSDKRRDELKQHLRSTP